MDLTTQDLDNCVEEINAIRSRAGLEQLTEFEYDECKPNNGHDCFSARNVFAELGAYVSTERVESDDEFVAKRLAEALDVNGFGAGAVKQYGVPIPPAILKVTDVFDNSFGHGELRDLFVEAGYVR